MVKKAICLFQVLDSWMPWNHCIYLSEAAGPLDLVARNEQSGEECHCGGEGRQGGWRGRVPHSGGHFTLTEKLTHKNTFHNECCRNSDSREVRKRSSKEEGAAIILLGIKSTKRKEEGLLSTWSELGFTQWFSRNSSAGDKKYERDGGRGQGQGGGKRGKDEKPRY